MIVFYCLEILEKLIKENSKLDNDEDEILESVLFCQIKLSRMRFNESKIELCLNAS